MKNTYNVIFISFIWIAQLNCYNPYRREFREIKVLTTKFGIKPPDKSTNFKASEQSADLSFDKPFVFFCTFNIEEEYFQTWIKQINIPQDLPDILGTNDSIALVKIRTINLPGYAITKEIDWWNPVDCNNQKRYVSFFNSDLKKVVIEFQKTWDGRILIVYCSELSKCDIIIETFM